MIHPGDGSKAATTTNETMTFSSKGKKPKNQIKFQMENDRNEKMLLQHLGLPFFFHRVAP